jgi:hypothetical protein
VGTVEKTVDRLKPVAQERHRLKPVLLNLCFLARRDDFGAQKMVVAGQSPSSVKAQAKAYSTRRRRLGNTLKFAVL